MYTEVTRARRSLAARTVHVVLVLCLAVTGVVTLSAFRPAAAQSVPAQSVPAQPAPAQPAPAQPGPCANEVACENTLAGTPNWQVDFLDEAIAGYTTDISSTAGGVVNFKIDTTAASYRVDIFRLGWYQGIGARQVGTLTRTTAQNQPDCLRDPATGLADCGNWSTSVSWQVPASAVSGIYYARLTRNDTGAQNEVAFVVRDDGSDSKILLQTNDSTWQAYNRYGGASMYVGDGPGKDGSAFKVSYNRPLFEGGNENFIFNSEYPMLRFLERNGYDLSYTTNMDTARRGNLIRNHDVFMAVGHDEYWSNEQRANVEAARDAGVHLAFLTGNEIFWKTRWEPSVDGTSTAWRTLVSYKETKAPQTDPSSEWTGTWRDPRFSPPKDGGRPENALLGNIFTVNGRRDDSLQVPSAYGRMRLWRNTSLASMAAGSTYTFEPGTLGYEWNTVEDNGFQPAGVAQLSRTTVDLVGPFALQNYGDLYDSETKTHALTMYRAPSGALVFGAGTVQWAWGVDDDHAFLTNTPTSDPRMQQATVNLLADMGVQPTNLQQGLVAAAASGDTAAPTVAITAGAAPRVGVPYTVSGTVGDAGGGQVAGVEVSTDSGVTWHPAVWTAGTTTWTYGYVPAASGTTAIQARAVDDSANLSTPTSAPTTVAAPQCPCSIWADTVTPKVVDTDDNGPIELGVKWRSATDGFVRGIRFYKGPGNTGTHTGSLWTPAGQLLANGTFTNETATGWQTMTFPSPVAVTAGTTYIASYHTPTGRYSSDVDYFTVQNAAQEPLTALRAGVDGPNGVFRAGGTGFPSLSFRNTNYWVDVVWAPDPGPDTRAPVITATSPVAGAGSVQLGALPSVTVDEAIDPASVQFTVAGPAGPVAGTTAVSADGRTVTFTPTGGLTAGTGYTATATVRDPSGNPLAVPATWSFTTGSVRPTSCPCTVWDDFTQPRVIESLDNGAIEVGTKVRFDGRGEMLGVRFYKGPGNTGTHTGSLWSATGERLATGTFTDETGSGWQTLRFAQPVQVQGNTTYVVSYFAPAGNYSVDPGYFNGTGADAGPMHALENGVDGGNGVYRYGAGGGFPTNSFNGGNYWVDAVYRNGLNGDTTPPTVTTRSPEPGATGVPTTTAVTVGFTEPVDVTSAQFALRDPGGARVTGTATRSPDGLTVTWTPAAPLAPNTAYAMSARIADDNGAAMAAPVTWSFTTAPAAGCPCSLFSTATVPTVVSSNDDGDYELGVRITPASPGKVTAVRFYKGPNNTGTHTGSLWNAAGQRLATGTFVGESASGWQTLVFPTPVTVVGGQTYTASYTTGGFYSADAGYFQRTTVNSPPLASAEGPNGVYAIGQGFPSLSFQGGNYWVDVVFEASADGTPPTVTARTPAPGATGVPVGTTVTAAFDEPLMATGAQVTVRDPGGALLTGTLELAGDQRGLTFTPAAPLAAGTTYAVRVQATDAEGNAMAAPDSWSFTTSSAVACPCSLFSSATVPTVVTANDDGDYELGVRFTSAVDGFVTGVRFYKGPNNTGPHTGSVWGPAGELLGTGTFVDETATGWQTLVLAAPVPVTAGQVHSASYTTNGFYSTDAGYFGATAVASPPLTAAAGTNGVYAVGTGFPTNTYQGGNYWVDVVFATG